MALSSEIEAKSPDPMPLQEMKRPSMEPAPAPGGAPGLLGLLSRPGFLLKLSVTTLLLAAVALLLTPAAFPPRAGSPPPPLPRRAPARWPRGRVSLPVPLWMRGLTTAAPPSTPGGAAKLTPSSLAAGGLVARANSRQPAADSRRPAALRYPIRLTEPSGALCTIARSGVTVAGKRVPAPWAREVRRLFAAPAAEELAASPARPALRLLAPNPGDAALLSPPDHLRWAPVRGVGRYLITVETLTDPSQQTWSLVQDLLQLKVIGTIFPVPAKLRWAPGAVYRWRVQTGDEQISASGRFRILTARQRQHLWAARRSFAKSHLLCAAIYHSYGLYNAALTELHLLHAAPAQQPALHRAVINVEADIQHQRSLAAQ